MKIRCHVEPGVERFPNASVSSIMETSGTLYIPFLGGKNVFNDSLPPELINHLITVDRMNPVVLLNRRILEKDVVLSGYLIPAEVC